MFQVVRIGSQYILTPYPNNGALEDIIVKTKTERRNVSVDDGKRETVAEA